MPQTFPKIGFRFHFHELCNSRWLLVVQILTFSAAVTNNWTFSILSFCRWQDTFFLLFLSLMWMPGSPAFVYCFYHQYEWFLHFYSITDVNGRKLWSGKSCCLQTTGLYWELSITFNLLGVLKMWNFYCYESEFSFFFLTDMTAKHSVKKLRNSQNISRLNSITGRGI